MNPFSATLLSILKSKYAQAPIEKCFGIVTPQGYQALARLVSIGNTAAFSPESGPSQIVALSDTAASITFSSGSYYSPFKARWKQLLRGECQP
jgi:hypothetical protein